jgi:hypothetical protein
MQVEDFPNTVTLTCNCIISSSPSTYILVVPSSCI